MVNENIKLIENKKPVETVYELKNEIPSFEEFMKTYENDGSLNYDDLDNGDIGTQKGYGPCSSCSGSNRNIRFELKILLKNCIGAELGMIVYNTNNAQSEANKIVAETGHWEDRFLSCFSQENRRILAERIKEEVRIHKRGEIINETVSNNCWSDSRWRERNNEGMWELANEVADMFLENLENERFPGERGGRSFFMD